MVVPTYGVNRAIGPLALAGLARLLRTEFWW